MTTFTLEQVVPWGRTLGEYQAMFRLDATDLAKKILGCGDGPASFNAELTRRGGSVISVDPLYAFDRQEISQRIEETSAQVLAQLQRNRDQFVWDRIGSVAELGQLRHETMATFLADYDAGRAQGRYLLAALPDLPFADAAFDLALCSHFLFLYSDHLDTDFHCRALRDLCRVAVEIRVFPLLDLGGRKSPHLEPVLACLANAGLSTAIEPVHYEFQRGANQMLRITRPD